MRSTGALRSLTLSAAITLLAALWLTVVTGTGAGAAPGAPASTPGQPPTVNISPFPPTVPGDLRVTAVTANSITLAWTASASGCCGVEGYDIFYTQAYNDIFWSQDAGNVTTFTLTSAMSIRPATQYNLRVSARDGLGHRSAASNSVSVVTPLSDSSADTTAPTAPADLTLTGVTAAGAGLTWSAASDDVAVTGYNVYRFDGLFVSTLLATVAGTSYTAPLSGRDNFYVRARDAAGNVSLSSNLVSVTSTSAPPTSPSPSSPPPPACRVTYATSAQWAGGFVADVKVTNLGPAPVTGWTLAFDFGGDQRIATVWNATFRQTGPAVTLTNLDWNRVIAPGAGASVGLVGSWTTNDAKPTAATLNGAPCTLG